MSSRFLPAQWSSATPIALLAGQGGEGSYPYLMARRALDLGVPLRLIALKGETDAALASLFPAAHQAQVAVGDLGALLKANRQLGVGGLIMAGRVTPSRLFREALPDLRAIALLASLKEKNAETIFGAVAAEIEKEGVRVLDARVFMDADMASVGHMSVGREKVAEDALAHGIKIAEAMAQYDVGQSVVVRKGTVLAVEAFEGTDAMIARAADYKADAKVFVKTVKARQDWRLDVPIFGLPTVEGLARAKVGTALLKADGVIIPDRSRVLTRAHQLGIQIIGY
jgi:UDP-2,3-diacylglucosamine hydrolase